LMVKYPKALAEAIALCRKGQSQTQTGLKKGVSGEFVVVEQGKNKKSRFAELANRGYEVLNVFENDRPWGVVINNVVLKYEQSIPQAEQVNKNSKQDKKPF